MQVYTVSPELYFDLSLLKASGKAEDMSIFESSIGLLDSVGKTVYALGITNKNGVIVGGGDALSSAKQIAAYGDFLYVITSTGISIVSIKDQKTKPDVIKAAPEWGTLADMDVFGGISISSIPKNPEFGNTSQQRRNLPNCENISILIRFQTFQSDQYVY